MFSLSEKQAILLNKLCHQNCLVSFNSTNREASIPKIIFSAMKMVAL